MNIKTTTTTVLATLSAMSIYAQKQPNVIYIMTDQQSASTISALSDIYGECYSETPNIDRLVKSGITFTNSYCANPVSVPSRFALFTGRYGSELNVRGNADKSKINQKTQQFIGHNGMGAIFKKAGYDTYYGGKIHLPEPKGAKNEQKAPYSYGFDTYYEKNERTIMAHKAAEIINERANRNNDKPFLLVASFINPHDICVVADSTFVKSADKGRLSPEKAATRETVRTLMAEINNYGYDNFIDDLAPELPSNLEETKGVSSKTYVTNAPRPEYSDNQWREYRWIYEELISQVDGDIGIILDAIDANPELKKNTIVIFTSDHGDMQGSHRLTKKRVPFEECQRIPLFIMAEGIEAGSRSDILTSGVDIIPTMCDFTGIDVSDYKLSGLSLAQVALGKDKDVDRDYLYGEAEMFVNIVKGDYKYTLYNNKVDEILVNLKRDPGETKNLLSTDSKKYRKIADELRGLLPEKMK